MVILLIIGGMALLIIGSWKLSEGLNGVVIGHGNFYIHFSEVTAAQEVTNGIVCSVLGVACFMAFIILYVKRRNFLFPPQKEKPK